MERHLLLCPLRSWEDSQGRAFVDMVLRFFALHVSQLKLNIINKYQATFEITIKK